MPTRNTPVLERIIKALGITAQHSLARLEEAFKDSLIVVAGDVKTVARDAEKLRLAITTEECAVVLDYLDVEISIDTEEAINSLFPDRFVEP